MGKKKIVLQIVEIPSKSIRLNCSIHGVVKHQSAYDPFLKKMTGISCAKCPTITAENHPKLAKEDN